jgi:LDH2 family malate/lactate/ureidoglycolate dehydrogenase
MNAAYRADDLATFATALLDGVGLDGEKSRVVAEILLEADLLGHNTHGLHLLALYLEELANGRMAKSGTPGVVADFPAAITWDGMRLPGPWLVARAVHIALARAKANGTCTVVIRRSHHIACLASYLRPVAESGMMIILACSDPRMGAVAPHGGRRGVYTPNPIAAAWPTDVGPVMIDTSMSIVSHGIARRFRDEKRRLPGPWLIDADGNPTDDPSVLFADPPGAALPIGGLDHGYKGFGLGLLVEALTGGLAGHGRADSPSDWTNNVFLQVLDPALFGGLDNFRRQTTWLAAACRQTPPRPGFDRVRLPGERALQLREQQLKEGVALYPSILPALTPWARRLGVALPAPL